MEPHCHGDDDGGGGDDGGGDDDGGGGNGGGGDDVSGLAKCEIFFSPGSIISTLPRKDTNDSLWYVSFLCSQVLVGLQPLPLPHPLVRPLLASRIPTSSYLSLKH